VQESIDDITGAEKNVLTKIKENEEKLSKQMYTNQLRELIASTGTDAYDFFE